MDARSPNRGGISRQSLEVREKPRYDRPDFVITFGPATRKRVKNLGMCAPFLSMCRLFLGFLIVSESYYGLRDATKDRNMTQPDP
jgi:hypothetical protein